MVQIREKVKEDEHQNPENDLMGLSFYFVFIIISAFTRRHKAICTCRVTCPCFPDAQRFPAVLSRQSCPVKTTQRRRTRPVCRPVKENIPGTMGTRWKTKSAEERREFRSRVRDLFQRAGSETCRRPEAASCQSRWTRRSRQTFGFSGRKDNKRPRMPLRSRRDHYWRGERCYQAILSQKTHP